MNYLRVTVSPKYQIVIPKELREKLRIRAGQKLVIYNRKATLVLEPARRLRELRGVAKGLRWTEEDRDRAGRL